MAALTAVGRAAAALAAILALCLLTSVAAAAADASTAVTRGRLEGRVVVNPHLTTLAKLAPNARVILNNGEHVGFIREDGSFSIARFSPNVPSGSYALDVVAEGLAFDKLMVQFTARDKAATRAYRLVPGVTILEQEPLPYPLRLEARGKLDYFAKRQGFSLWGILTNPMILITGVVLLLGYAMPKLTEGIDMDAIRAEAAALQQQQQQQQQPQQGGTQARAAARSGGR